MSFASKPASEQEIVSAYSEVVGGVPDSERQSINSKLEAIAIHFGLIIPGRTVREYMWHAAENMRYATTHVWGEQGSMKSSFTLQSGGWIYGERVNGQWYSDWDVVLKNLVFKPGKEERGFLWYIKKIPCGSRTRWAGWDDLGVHFPNTMWRTDMPKYQAIDSAWAAIRTKISTVTTNNPLIDRVAKNIKDNISIEVYLGPNQAMQAERFCRIPGIRKVESFFFKVLIENSAKFDYSVVPPDVWKEYWDLRLRLADEAIQKLDDAYEKEPEDLSQYIPVYEIFDQEIATPSKVLTYASRDLITIVKVGGKRYIHKDDVEHVLKAVKKPQPQRVSGE
jgi:hypothetical protein